MEVKNLVDLITTEYVLERAIKQADEDEMIESSLWDVELDLQPFTLGVAYGLKQGHHFMFIPSGHDFDNRIFAALEYLKPLQEHIGFKWTDDNLLTLLADGKVRETRYQGPDIMAPPVLFRALFNKTFNQTHVPRLTSALVDYLTANGRVTVKCYTTLGDKCTRKSLRLFKRRIKDFLDRSTDLPISVNITNGGLALSAKQRMINFSLESYVLRGADPLTIMFTEDDLYTLSKLDSDQASRMGWHGYLEVLHAIPQVLNQSYQYLPLYLQEGAEHPMLPMVQFIAEKNIQEAKSGIDDCIWDAEWYPAELMVTLDPESYVGMKNSVVAGYVAEHICSGILENIVQEHPAWTYLSSPDGTTTKDDGTGTVLHYKGNNIVVHDYRDNVSAEVDNLMLYKGVPVVVDVKAGLHECSKEYLGRMNHVVTKAFGVEPIFIELMCGGTKFDIQKIEENMYRINLAIGSVVSDFTSEVINHNAGQNTIF